MSSLRCCQFGMYALYGASHGDFGLLESTLCRLTIHVAGLLLTTPGLLGFQWVTLFDSIYSVDVGFDSYTPALQPDLSA